MCMYIYIHTYTEVIKMPYFIKVMTNENIVGETDTFLISVRYHLCSH